MSRQGIVLCIGKIYEAEILLDAGQGCREELEWSEIGGAAPLTAIRLQDLGRNARLWTSYGGRNRFAEEILNRHRVETKYIRRSDGEREIGKTEIRILHDSRTYEKRTRIQAPNIELDFEVYNDYANTQAVFLCNLLEFDKYELQGIVKGLKRFREKGIPVFAAMEIDFFESRIELIRLVFPMIDHLILHFSVQAVRDERFENMLQYTEAFYRGKLVIDTGTANDGICYYRTDWGTRLGVRKMKFESRNCYGAESVFNAYYAEAILEGRTVENALFRARNAAIKSCGQVRLEKLKESEFSMIPAETLKNVMKIGPMFVSVKQACVEEYPGNLLGWIGISRDYPYVIKLNALNPQQMEGIEAVMRELLDEERLLVEAVFKKRICFDELWRYTAYKQLEERKYGLITPENLEIILSNAWKLFRKEENIAVIIWGIEAGKEYRKRWMHSEETLDKKRSEEEMSASPAEGMHGSFSSHSLSKRAIGVLRRSGIRTEEQLLALLRGRNGKKRLLEMRGMGDVLFTEIMEKMQDRI